MMTDVNRMLFGVDGSDFSRTSLAAVGKLMAGNRKFGIEIFFGVPDPTIFRGDRGENLSRLKAESTDFLDKAKKALIEAGVEEERVSIVLRENCNDPAGFMLDFAEAEKFDIIGLARFGSSTISRHVIGSVCYRVASSSKNTPVWIVDHRVRSRNVLVCLVGAPIGQRVIDHAAKHFFHLHDSRFTLFHVIPTFTLEEDRIKDLLADGASKEKLEGLMETTNLRLTQAETVLEDGKRKLIQAGIPEKNIDLKKQKQEEGIARDILTELGRGDNGILVTGCKGSGDIQQFGLGSKAYKLLCAARTFVTCLVN